MLQYVDQTRDKNARKPADSKSAKDGNAATKPDNKPAADSRTTPRMPGMAPIPSSSQIFWKSEMKASTNRRRRPPGWPLSPGLKGLRLG